MPRATDPAALQAIILAQHQKIAEMEASSWAYEALIQALKLTIGNCSPGWQDERHLWMDECLLGELGDCLPCGLAGEFCGAGE